MATLKHDPTIPMPKGTQISFQRVPPEFLERKRKEQEMHQEKQKWEAVYLQADYVVLEGQNKIVIRISEPSAELDELLKQNEAKSWAFMTAYNPFSKLLSEEENAARQADLQRLLQERNFRFLNGYGESPNGDWNAEPSVFVFEIDRQTAVEIGRQFDQHAIVFGKTGELPELVWC